MKRKLSLIVVMVFLLNIIPSNVITEVFGVTSEVKADTRKTLTREYLEEFNGFIVDGININSTSITGKGVAGATVSAYIDGVQIGRDSEVEMDGTFKIDIPKQQVGTFVVVKMSKPGYATSEMMLMILNIVNDYTVNEINVNSTSITGTAEIGSTLGAYADGRQIGPIIEVSQNGTYEIPIEKQKAGTKVSVKIHKPGYAVNEKVVTVLDVYDYYTMSGLSINSTSITGKGLVGATVEAYVNGVQIGSSTKIASDGTYKLPIPKQELGTSVVLKISKEGYSTFETILPVVNIVNDYTVNQINANSTTISGKAEIGSTLGAYVNGLQIGPFTEVAPDGTYKLTIEKQKAGTKVAVKIHKPGYMVNETIITVLNGYTANAINVNSTTITGKAVSGSTVGAYVNGKLIGTTVKVASDGTYKITIPKQKAGTKVVVKINKSGYEPFETTLTVSNVFSSYTVNNINTSSTTISGKGVSGATVGAYINGKLIGKTVKVASDGTYKITIPKQKDGVKVVVKISKSGYAPTEKTITVLKVFSGFVVNNINTNSTSITGKNVSGATVAAYVNGKQIGKSVKVASNGTFKITIPKQKAGTKVVVKTSKSGYAPTEKTTTVLKVFTGYTVNSISVKTTTITGKGVSGATVAAYVNGKQIGKTAKVSSNGMYKITIPRQKAGVKVVVKISKSGYAESSKTITVKK